MVLFLIYINDLPESLLRSFVDINADDTTVLGCSSIKSLKDDYDDDDVLSSQMET